MRDSLSPAHAAADEPERADLSKLKIDRDLAPVRGRRRRRWLWLAAVIVVAVAGGGWYALQPRVDERRHDARRDDVSVAAVRRAQRDRLRRRAAQGGDLVEGDRAPRMARRGRRLARQGRRRDRAHRRARRRRAGGERRGRRARRARGAGAGAGRGARCAGAAEAQRRTCWRRASYRRPSVDTAKARADRATAGVANARANDRRRPRRTRATPQVAVDYTMIRAPFDGVILSKSANVGDLVTPFSNAADSKGAVVSMADMSTLEVEADVSESSLAQGQGRPAGGDHARCAARHALPRPHQPHGADGRPREGDRHDQGASSTRSTRASCRR